MQLLASWTIRHGGEPRTIQLLQGDLARLPREHSVDVLVVSAFKNNYDPTPTSLIGALARQGLSVADLAEHKKVDLRSQFSCWLSGLVPNEFAFRQILCIESGWHGSPPEIADDLFRSLAPYLIGEFPNASVAMPLIGTGDQGFPPESIVESLFPAAVGWIHRGLPLRLLKIVVYSEAAAKLARGKFDAMQAQSAPETRMPEEEKSGIDLFLSYCHEDSQAAKRILDAILAVRPATRIFYDRTSLRTGTSWLMQIAESLDTSRRVVALYTPNYWKSNYCKDEFTAAITRQNDTGERILFPVYFRNAQLPYLFQHLQYLDCREGDEDKLSGVCAALLEGL
jgi:TIR domain